MFLNVYLLLIVVINVLFSLPVDLTKPLMKEHCKYLQEEEYKSFYHSYLIRIFVSLRESDVGNDQQNSPWKMLAEIVEEPSSYHGLRIVWL